MRRYLDVTSRARKEVKRPVVVCWIVKLRHQRQFVYFLMKSLVAVLAEEKLAYFVTQSKAWGADFVGAVTFAGLVSMVCVYFH